MTLNASLVVSGRESAREFFQRTRPDWERLARHIMRTAPPIPDIGEEDVMQELQVVAWRALASYDPKRSSNPDRYLIFQALARTKRWHRRQLRRGGRAGSPEVMGDIDLDHFESTSPHQPQKVAEARSELRRIVDQISERKSSIALAAVIGAEGDLELAAEQIYSDIKLSIYYQLDGPGVARRLVREVINQVRSSEQ